MGGRFCTFTQGMAAWQAIVEEGGSPVMLMLRLKVADKKITEVETQVTQPPQGRDPFSVHQDH